MQTTIATRLKHVRRALEDAGANTLVETHAPNIYYLSGFTGDSGMLVVEPSSVTLFTDGRFTIQAKEEAHGVRTRINRGGSLVASIGAHLRRKSRVRSVIAPSRLSLEAWTTLKKAGGRSIRWLALGGLVEHLRAVKDASEIDRIRDAAKLGSEVMEEIIRMVRPGVTELDLAAEIAYRMRRKGASGEYFEAIVAVGPRSALPHA